MQKMSVDICRISAGFDAQIDTSLQSSNFEIHLTIGKLSREMHSHSAGLHNSRSQDVLQQLVGLLRGTFSVLWTFSAVLQNSRSAGRSAASVRVLFAYCYSLLFFDILRFFMFFLGFNLVASSLLVFFTFIYCVAVLRWFLGCNLATGSFEISDGQLESVPFIKVFTLLRNLFLCVLPFE